MTENDIKNLWIKFHVPKNIQRHMEKVTEIAVRIGKKLIDNKFQVDLKLLRQAALLHDLAKIVTCFSNINSNQFDDAVKVEDIEAWNKLSEKYSGMSDCEITKVVLREMGEDKIAEIVRKHHFTSVLKEEESPSTLEEKVLYYADKLVMHDKEVTLEKRMKDLDERYSTNGNIPEYIREAKKRARQIEKEIKAKLE